MKKSGLIAVILILIVLIVGGFFVFNGSYKNKSDQEGTSGSGNSITIKNFAFNPGTLTIKAGDTVVWTNEDSVSHTITSDSGSELNSETISPGNTYSHTFITPETYAYHCSIHTSMKGTIIVE